MTKMVNKRTFNAQVRKFYAKWTKDFLECCSSGKVCLYVPKNKTFVEDQIEFIRRYMGFLFLDGDTEWNLKRIERFLSMQTRFSDPGTIELRFIGGTPVEAVAIVETLNDIDLADVHCILGLDKIYAIKFGRRRWTTKSFNTFMEEVQKDITYDGTKVSLSYQIYSRNCIIIRCKVKE